MLLSGWWRVERNCKKVQLVNIFTCLNILGCLQHEVQVSVYGCEVSLSLCLYLQMRTFERIGSLWVSLYNWCWYPYSDKSLHSAARTGFKWSTVHYRYVCTLWRPWTSILFYASMVYEIPTAGWLLTRMAHHWTMLCAGIFQIVS